MKDRSALAAGSARFASKTMRRAAPVAWTLLNAATAAALGALVAMAARAPQDDGRFDEITIHAAL